MSLMSLLVQRARGPLIVAVACGALGGASNTAFLALVNERLGGAALSIPVLAGGFAAISAVMLATYWLSRSLLIRLLQHTIRDLRLHLSQQVLAAPLARLERIGTARLLTILGDDVSAIAGSLGLVPAIGINGVMVLGSLIYLGALSGRLLALLVVLLVLAVASYAALDARAGSALRQARDAIDQLGEDLEGIIHGNRELKLHRARRLAFLATQLQPHLDTVRDRAIRGNSQYALAVSWGQILTVLLIGIVLFVVPSFLSLGDGVLRGYALAVIQITGGIGALLEALPALRQAQISWSKIEQLRGELAAPAAPEGPGGAPDRALDRFDRLELVDVTCTIDRGGDSPFTLGPINLAFHPGLLVFVTGGNGSGKTTLAKVLAGLYAPSSGEIRVDGAAIGQDRRDAYRQLFSVAFTDGHVFRSLLGLDAAQIRDHLARFELDPWVHVDGGALSTTALSQGQRNRLLLATALAEDRPFYIFDEWTANQDPPFRARFYREILPALRARGKAILVITHDDRYDAMADLVIRLDRGAIRHDPAPRAGREEGPACASP